MATASSKEAEIATIHLNRGFEILLDSGHWVDPFITH